MNAELETEGKTRLAQVLGIVGGVLGIAAGFVAMLVGGAGLLLAADTASVIWLGSLGAVLGAVGIFGASITKSNPAMAIALMIVAGLGGFVAVSIFWLLPGVLLLVGALVEWNAQSKRGPARV